MITKREEKNILRRVNRGISFREITRSTGHSYGTIKRTIERNKEWRSDEEFRYFMGLKKLPLLNRIIKFIKKIFNIK